MSFSSYDLWVRCRCNFWVPSCRHDCCRASCCCRLLLCFLPPPFQFLHILFKQKSDMSRKPQTAEFRRMNEERYRKEGIFYRRKSKKTSTVEVPQQDEGVIKTPSEVLPHSSNEIGQLEEQTIINEDVLMSDHVHSEPEDDESLEQHPSFSGGPNNSIVLKSYNTCYNC